MKKIFLLAALAFGLSIKAQIITTVIGDTTMGNSGDGGPATAAHLNNPVQASMDVAGNIYIADQNNYNVRKVDPAGNISTVAGNGTAGYSGDGGPALSAQLGGPVAAMIGRHGDLYIVDYNNNVIRKVDGGGIITTVAGNGVAGYSGDGGPATAASLQGVAAIAFDTIGNMFLADNQNFVIRMVDTNGVITTVVGNGTAGYSGDGGPAINAQLTYPLGLMIDRHGNMYIGDTYNNCIRKVNTSGIITTVAGIGGPSGGYSGDGGLAINAMLNTPAGICEDTTGNLYIADASNNVVRKVDVSGVISTIAGNTVMGFSGDSGVATLAELNGPNSVMVTNSGTFYIVDEGNHCIRKMCLNTDSVFGYIRTPSNTPVTAGVVYAFRRQHTHNGLNDTLGFVNIQPNGYYSFPNIYGNNYLIKAIADTNLYPNSIGTYYGSRSNCYQWDSSSVVLFDPCNPATTLGDSITINMLSPSAGAGIISGQITCTPDFGTRWGGGVSVQGAPLKGIDVKLGKNPGGQVAARTTTDTSGNYSFTNLAAGDYSIYVDVPNFPMANVISVTLTTAQQSVLNDYYIDSAYVRTDTTAHTTMTHTVAAGLVDVKVYPNPAKSVLYIEGIDSEKIVCNLFDVNGNVVKDVVLTKGIHTLNLSEISEGVYNLSISSNNRVVNRRIVILR